MVKYFVCTNTIASSQIWLLNIQNVAKYNWGNEFVWGRFFWLHWIFVGGHWLLFAVRWLSLVAISRGYSLAVVLRLSLQRLLLLQSMGWDAQALVVVTHGLSCPAACGILVPGPRIKPMSPIQAGGFLTTGPPGKSQRKWSFNAIWLIKIKIQVALPHTTLDSAILESWVL